jgi:hypothetical protein|tara:strand:+ start:367 stop:618 length:252 start_codon:yes stop_codon:yes gene_type:complete
MNRNYKSEYKNYQGKPSQIKRRASRNTARAKMVAGGVAKKNDGKDVAHKNNNPLNNNRKNLKMSTKTSNRSFPRTKTAKRRVT